MQGQQGRGVSHNVASQFTLKEYLKAEEELWKLKYFTTQIILKKKSSAKKPKSSNILN
jgi:hypothetical protein